MRNILTIALVITLVGIVACSKEEPAAPTAAPAVVSPDPVTIAPPPEPVTVTTPSTAEGVAAPVEAAAPVDAAASGIAPDGNAPVPPTEESVPAMPGAPAAAPATPPATGETEMIGEPDNLRPIPSAK